ncbi:TetR/AcrR family transcriptional regulator [Verrucosispora sp. SN26_14.1]|uniref:TetR/AcrR family transcriptional regulator n=1 Tax=Verrucosispora sp. SN26_14.1 TaxID=2527879 RepID=UPI001034BF95|nr:TetR/AcrR family transcriptional regulator [Verrucosispora sp. SN26_14.1]TBL45049.1 TetR/AcrR family transcriptional regulator [Verrucosispora sp. SN26_14.1]
MPQPVKYSTDVLLDAVRVLLLDGGPAAASARAVCLATGASSGTVYHRFPTRDDLVAAAWLRAQDRFLDAYLGALSLPDTDHAVDAAATVLTWSRTHPEDATLLLRLALRDLLHRDLSAPLQRRAETNQRALHEKLTALATHTGHPLADVLLAVVDLPYTVVRRVLQTGNVPTDDDVAAVRRAATALLAPHPGVREKNPARPDPDSR